jgi:thymidylate synthase, flavin-dependent
MNIVEQSVELIDSMGSDLSVVNAARVSFHKESRWKQDPSWFGNNVLDEKDQKLISYLAKHNHWTPFAHCFLSFRIKAPIFVARQLVKHQVGLAWNEVSRRYVDDEPEFWFPKEWRKRAENVKQGSSAETLVPEDHNIWPKDSVSVMLMVYNDLLNAGVAPEQARMVLPQNMMTEWIWSGSLMAFARVCTLRLDPHAQKETQSIAIKIHDAVPKEFEHSWRALIPDSVFE